MQLPAEQPVPRRARISRAEVSLMGVCLVALLVLFAAGWMSRGRDLRAQGAEISGGKWHLTRGRARMASALVGNTLWVLGGRDWNGAASASAETFDLTQNVTHQALGLLSPSPLLARYDHTAEAVGPDIYLFGGLGGGSKVLGDVEKFDTRTGFLNAMAPMPTPRRMAHSVVYGGKIYVVGGSNAAFTRVGTLEIYDIATNTWTRGASMQVPREVDVALWNGQIVAAGGYSGASENQGVLRDVEIYDIATNRWRRMPSLTQPISAHHTVVSGDWVFLFGDYLTLSRVLAYNARTGVTREMPAAGFAPRRHVIAVAYKGRAYVVGGNTDDSCPPLDEVQVFDLKRLRQMAQAKPKP